MDQESCQNNLKCAIYARRNISKRLIAQSHDRYYHYQRKAPNMQLKLIVRVFGVVYSILYTFFETTTVFAFIFSDVYN